MCIMLVGDDGILVCWRSWHAPLTIQSVRVTPGMNNSAIATLQGVARTTDALNLTTLPRRVSAAEIDDFRVLPAHEPGGRRGWAVSGEALERFAAMTNWDYYEAALRFQKVLEVSGAHAARSPD